MPRITLLFTLSSHQIQDDLVKEFAHHHDVRIEPVDADGAPAVAISVMDGVSAIWDVRATVRMFDDDATELRDQDRSR